MRIFTERAPRLAATALAALGVAGSAAAQYSPYPQTSQPYAPTSQQSYVAPAQQTYAQAAQQPPAYPGQQPAFSAPQSGVAAQQPYTASATYPQYATAQGYNPARPVAVTPNPTAAPAYPAARYFAQPQASFAPTATAQAVPQQQAVQQQLPPQRQYAAPYTVPRVAMAYQNTTPPAETIPLNAPTLNGVQNVQPNGTQPPQPMAADDYATPGQMYPGQGAAGGGNCQTNGTGYEGYPANGTAYGASNSYSTFGHDRPGMMGRLLGRGGCNYWYGGVYGLLMERDNGDKVPLAFATSPMPAGDYPPADAVVLTTRNVDLDFQGGVEFRLGRTFGGGYDPCGGSCNCGPSWGLESVYWTLFEEDETATYVDNGSVRVYTMLDPRGLEYNHGAGYRPVRAYWDYAPPSEDYTNAGASPDVEVRLARVYSNFELHNVELNLLKLGVCGGGCGGGPAMYSVGCDNGSCDSCAGGTCPTACAPACGSRFSCTTVVGVRWMRLDEDFMYGVDFDIIDAAYPDPNDGSLNYWAVTENNLVGPQVGCNGMYRVGCKWGIHCNTLVGIYGNDIDVRQYMVSPTGLVRFIDTGENFDVSASKTDVAMLGEVRLGASYQATCRCRLYGGWRAIGLTGVALATDQAPGSFISAAQLANYVNSNGSMILHGLQTGVEWNY
jgi:hypothetical protein